MIAEKALTPNDLLTLDLPEDKKWELRDGELIEVGRGNLEHEFVKINILQVLLFFAAQNRIGRAFAETMFTIGNGSRIPDVAFVLNAKLAGIASYDQVAPFAPDLAVEVIAPSETAYYAETKVDDYLAAGVQEVWQVYPQKRIVRVRSSAGLSDFGADAVLQSPVLPGFQTPVRDLFPAI